MKKLFLTISVLLIVLATFAQVPIKEPPISQERLKMYAYGAIAWNNYQMMNIYAEDKSPHSQKLAKISYERFLFYYDLSCRYQKKITKKNDSGNTIVF